MSKKKYVLEVEEGRGIIGWLKIFVLILLVIGVVYLVLYPDARNNIIGSMTSKLSFNNTSSEISNLSNRTIGLTNDTKNLTHKITNLSNKTKN
jgi:hypothetical protein